MIMEFKKINQLVKSFVVLPIVTLTLPFGNVGTPEVLPTQAVFVEKINTITSGLLTLNPSENTEVNDRDTVNQTRALAIDAYFKSKNMPLAGYGLKMVLEAEKNELDWRLLPAISVIETTGGKFMCKNPKAPNNPFGWGSCKLGFKSIDIAIETVARNLGGNNPRTARHYAEKDTKGILEAYNPPAIVPNYVPKVVKVMETIGEHDLGLKNTDTETEA